MRRAFEIEAARSRELDLAAPYFSYHEPLLEAHAKGATIRLLVCLNSATHPDSLIALFGKPRVSIRFFTGRFHAKVFLFDEAALVGSANLTRGGFEGNREAVVWLCNRNDEAALDQARSVFDLFWDTAQTLSRGTIDQFRRAWLATRMIGPDPDAQIALAVGKCEPPNIGADQQHTRGAKLRAERLRRMIEDYRAAFQEVEGVLTSENLFRADVQEIGLPFRVNRFLNWLRLTHAQNDTWKDAPFRSPHDRMLEIKRWGTEWRDAADGRVDEGYAEGIDGVLAPFANGEELRTASRKAIMNGLLGVHAFAEQSRFTDGGKEALPSRFWNQNNEDVEKVRETLAYLLHGDGDFVDRLNSVTNEVSRRLSLFGKFCALELSGTVNPGECPPVNGRSAKALRFLGFRVAAD